MTAGYAAYARTHARALRGRELEAEALLKAARLLEVASLPGASPGAVAEALDFTLKLWSVFEADLMKNPNRLPADLRADMLRLSRFMENAVRTAARNPVRADYATMIEINRNLAAGLM